ncbi:MAG TPA: WecB/TagA/CpsF family glycosyltransferase [Thermohalobaculum sp.]|nr:WecB/TagA/CpsF family glycosyltransferase [Thermohalobaculum sp.]
MTVPSRAALIAAVEERLRAGRGFTLATLNLDHLVKLGRDRAFAAAYARQTFVVADGHPVVWLARLGGRPVELVPGSELVEPLAALAARAGRPVALVGATGATLDAARKALEARIPGLAIVCCLAPSTPFDPGGAEADALIDRLMAAGPALCLVALGAPRQEIFAARAHARMPGTGFASVGAGLDFVAGTERRAPAWVRLAALEWLWRLGSSPRRLGRRYLDCALIMPGLALAALRTRLGPRPR